MRQIFGYVLVLDTNLGIPNLVVAAFDSKFELGDATKRSPTSATVRSLGRRLGSVLTDEKGRFALSADDLEFSGNEPRPDLVLVVFAPEDVADADKPYPQPPEKRILYMSTVARDDAGAEESFVIRLLQAQLDRFKIDPRGHGLANSLESGWALRDTLNARMSGRLTSERRKSQAAQDRARKKTRDLCALPQNLRDNKLLVIGKANLEARREALQALAVAKGLERMRQADVEPFARLYLDESEMKSLGLRFADGKLVGKVDADAILKNFGALAGAPDLILRRVRDIPDIDTLKSRYLIPSADQAGPVDVQ